MIGKTLLAAVMGLGVVAGAAHADAASGATPWGNWTLNDGRVTVNVFQCQGTKVCANVVRLQEPNNADGTPKLDLKNKDPSQRSRRLIGMPVLTGMEQTGSNSWKGQIYSSDDGSYYSGYAKMNGDKLNVKGCWFVICRDLNFNRNK
ncbi:DUF2147 domain-containing protein [Aestuariivirga litoralis]|uniref:DUF2147 domain-containing protein n=1 Tax=Aestuariivirga litoralis TaxID=2650924 RepID=UPI0018C5ECC3|nr:DUF2147 domain-containing protein [Aestuariivirga litoralis]MBG1231542.1 DUF2147 domain-containing protein [Aestuariivirga litoralis]